MIIHGQTFDPTQITRLVITYPGGLLDLSGAAAVEAMQAIRRVRPKPSKGKSGPKPTAATAIISALIAAKPLALTIPEISERARVSQTRTAAIIGELVESGQVENASDAPPNGGRKAARYRLSSP